MKKTKNKVIKVLAVLLILVGVAVMLQYPIREHLVQRNTNNLLAITPEEMRENRERETVIDFDGVQDVSTGAILRASTQDHSRYVIGRIEVEAVSLDLPIINTLTDESLYWGAAVMKADQVMGEGNYTLSSHHMKNPDLLFSPLDRAEIGDEIVISDDTGRYIYVVTEIEVISPTAVDVLEDVEGETLITLITCADEGENRLMVRGEFVRKESE